MHWRTSGRLVQELNVCTVDTQLRESFICLAYFYFDVVSMYVCTTRRCLAFGRLVQELNVFTVSILGITVDLIMTVTVYALTSQNFTMALYSQINLKWFLMVS